ncbi:unnamed protein product [Diatraea saccharalis]|uniref:Uncharacterized protein n=1 Tax=Diatraea saccharalis TaxID=40085 RepID=A0A9N9WDJ0_9NEOP|nr:unnamed protein product [Diatraea saccharalis]
MNGRRKVLMIHGIPEDTSQLMSRVVLDKLKADGFTIGDIKDSYRLRQSSNHNKPRPIIAKFQLNSTRNRIWSSKSKLKNTGITLSEYLTHSRRTVFMAAREKYGINRCWTRDGVIPVLGLNNTRHRITYMEELHSIDSEPANSVASLKTAPKTRRIAATKNVHDLAFIHFLVFIFCKSFNFFPTLNCLLLY